MASYTLIYPEASDAMLTPIDVSNRDVEAYPLVSGSPESDDAALAWCRSRMKRQVKTTVALERRASQRLMTSRILKRIEGDIRGDPPG